MPVPIYLDNNSTTPIDPAALEAMIDVYKNQYGNASSSTHPYGWYAAELIQIAREDVANLLGASPEEIIFTSGATESNNLAILGVANASRGSDRRRLLTLQTEHDAVLDPIQVLGREPDFDAEVLPVCTDGIVDPECFRAAMSEQTLLSSIMLANNEIGVLQDIPSLSAIAEAAGAITHCDATQAVGKIPVDVTVLNVDLLSCTAHKMYGPKGVGALYIRSGRRHPRIKPLVHGGGHEKGLRSGTLNVAGIVGFGVACRIARQQLEQEAIRINSLSTRLLATLQEELGEVDLNGSAQHRIPGNLNLHIKGVDSTRLLGLTNTKVAYSTSAACQSNSHVPSHVLQAIGLSEAEQRRSIRIGIGRFTSQEEVDLAGEILCRAVKELRDQAQHK